MLTTNEKRSLCVLKSCLNSVLIVRPLVQYVYKIKNTKKLARLLAGVLKMGVQLIAPKYSQPTVRLVLIWGHSVSKVI